MPTGHGNPDDLRKLAKQLDSTAGSVKSLADSVRKTLGSIDWKDAVKDKIDGDVKSALKELDKFASQLTDHAREVTKKAAQLDEYLNR